MSVFMLILASYLLEGLINVFVLQQNATNFIEIKSNSHNIFGDELKNMSITDTPSTPRLNNVETSTSDNSNQCNEQKMHRNIKIKEEFHFNVTQNIQLFDPDWDPTLMRNNNHSVPNIIMNLYQSLANTDSIRRFNLIKCLHITEYSHTSNGIVIKFVSDGIQNVEKFVGAELYIYRLAQHFENSSADSNIIRLYQILSKDEIVAPTHGNQSIDVNELLGVIYVSPYDQGWQIFNVEKSLEKMKNGKLNLNFLISVTDTWGNIIDPKKFNIATTESSYSPLLVMRQFHNTSDSISIQNLYKNYEPANESQLPITRNICSRYNFYIDFKTNIFKNFIIHPKGLMLYKCTGICQLQLTDNFTNHAKLLKINEKYNGTGEITESHCVPSNYLPATIVFYDRFGDIVIKKYNNMIANSCNCR